MMPLLTIQAVVAAFNFGRVYKMQQVEHDQEGERGGVNSLECAGPAALWSNVSYHGFG